MNDVGSERASSVLIVGATGLVGSACVRRFAGHPAFGRVIAVVRRSLPSELALPTVESHTVDFERLDGVAALFRVSHVLCALGTTIKRAGTRDRFRRVDYDYALTAARLGAQQGARHLLLVSALGADSGSRIFYSRVKGELERDVRALAYRSITVVRPSLLLGERAEFRLGEEIVKRGAFLAPAKYKPVSAEAVAAVLLDAALADRPGVRVIESAEIRARARELCRARSVSCRPLDLEGTR